MMWFWQNIVIQTIQSWKLKVWVLSIFELKLLIHEKLFHSDSQLFLKHVMALTVKRFHHSKRNKKGFVCEVNNLYYWNCNFGDFCILFFPKPNYFQKNSFTKWSFQKSMQNMYFDIYILLDCLTSIFCELGHDFHTYSACISWRAWVRNITLDLPNKGIYFLCVVQIQIDTNICITCFQLQKQL